MCIWGVQLMVIFTYFIHLIYIQCWCLNPSLAMCWLRNLFIVMMNRKHHSHMTQSTAGLKTFFSCFQGKNRKLGSVRVAELESQLKSFLVPLIKGIVHVHICVAKKNVKTKISSEICCLRKLLKRTVWPL